MQQLTDISGVLRVVVGVQQVVAGVSAGGAKGGGGGGGALTLLCPVTGAVAAGEIQPRTQTERLIEQTGLAPLAQTWRTLELTWLL